MWSHLVRNNAHFTKPILHSLMGCIFRLRFNNLGSIWYTALCLAVQLYLLYLGLERYRLYTEMKWPQGTYPRVWLTVYISVLAACIPLLVLFTAFGILKSGNLAGDNDQLGARTYRTIELTRRRERRQGCLFCLCHSARSFWMHSPPFPQTIHLALALCQLFAQQIMLAQLYRFGFINSGDFLNTELDFVYQKSRQLATNLPMGDTRLQGFRITSEELADSPMAPNLLPILMHARLFGIPLEFANLLVALIAYACAYPSVFWRLNQAFSLWFSVHLLIHSATMIWTYLSFSVLFRVQETNYYSYRPVGIGHYLWPLRPLQIYHPLAIIVMFIATVVLMQIAPVILYAYGYNKYLCGLAAYRRRSGSTSSVNPSDLHQQPVLCCDGYGPHIAAIMILMMLVIVKAPMLYALTLLYQQEERPLIFTCILMDAIYLFTWILLWLVLTLKRDWRFRVIHSAQEILSLQDAQRTADGTSAQSKCSSDLKNALLLMHRDHLFVTDDPLTKPSIMRHVLKSCMQDNIYWLRGGCGNNTNQPLHCQSPSNRRILSANDQLCNGSASRGPNTPELNRLLDCPGAASIRLVGASTLDCDDVAMAANVPLAVPPFQQRMAAGGGGGLSTSIMQRSTMIGGGGTLQRSANSKASEYGTYYGNNNKHKQLPLFGQQDSSDAGIYSSAYNQVHPPESYASIHRSRNNRGGIAGGGDYGGILRNQSSGKPASDYDTRQALTLSPQIMTRKANAASVSQFGTIGRRGNGGQMSREVIISGPPMPPTASFANNNNRNFDGAPPEEPMYGHVGSGLVGSTASGFIYGGKVMTTSGISGSDERQYSNSVAASVKFGRSGRKNSLDAGSDVALQPAAVTAERQPTFHQFQQQQQSKGRLFNGSSSHLNSFNERGEKSAAYDSRAEFDSASGTAWSRGGGVNVHMPPPPPSSLSIAASINSAASLNASASNNGGGAKSGTHSNANDVVGGGGPKQSDSGAGGSLSTSATTTMTSSPSLVPSQSSQNSIGTFTSSLNGGGVTNGPCAGAGSNNANHTSSSSSNTPIPPSADGGSSKDQQMLNNRMVNGLVYGGGTLKKTNLVNGGTDGNQLPSIYGSGGGGTLSTSHLNGSGVGGGNGTLLRSKMVGNGSTVRAYAQSQNIAHNGQPLRRNSEMDGEEDGGTYTTSVV